MRPFAFEIPYLSAPEAFDAVSAMPYSLFLDSADSAHHRGCFSFIAIQPVEVIEASGRRVRITNANQQTTLQGNPFEIVQQRLNDWRMDSPHQTLPDLPPFQGGAAGLFGYDLGRALESLPEIARTQNDMPDMAVGLYDQVIAFDLRANKAWIIIQDKAEERACHRKNVLLRLLEKNTATKAAVANDSGCSGFAQIEWTADQTQAEFTAQIKRVIDYIRAGDIFQANLAQRFTASLPAGFDSWEHYKVLRMRNPAPFAAYMNLGDIKISSASPERFLHVRGATAQSCPIKGTAPVGADPKSDAQNIACLQTSEKDRAENIMIVDLLRNDLSRCCEDESIIVSELCALETFASVHHLVSTVQGTLREGQTALDVLRTCFPGGSITGAPKIRAMEIIEELEPIRRGPYTGAIGYIGFDGAMDTNILIRTLVYQDAQVSLQAGGGITAQSDPDAEYQETLDKAQAMFDSFLADKSSRKTA